MTRPMALLLAAALLVLTAPCHALPGPPTAFSFQGLLTLEDAPLEGDAEIEVRLYDEPVDGSVRGTPNLFIATVDDGYVSLELDFGLEIITYRDLWLEFRVRRAGSGEPMRTLAPRHRLLPSPKSVFALADDDGEDAGGALPHRILTVGMSGAQFGSLEAALDALAQETWAQATILVGPGAYVTYGGLRLPENVHLIGSGRDATILRSAAGGTLPGPDAATLVLGANAQVSQLAIENVGEGHDYAVGLYLLPSMGGSTLVDHVAVRVSGEQRLANYAVFLADAEPIIRDSVLEASGATGFGTAVNAAVYARNGNGALPQPRFERSRLSGANDATTLDACAGSSGTGYGLFGVAVSPTLVDSVVCGTHRGVAMFNVGTLRLRHSQLATSATAGAFLIEAQGAGVMLLGSEVSYVGNKFTGTGDLACQHSYRSNGQAASDGTTPETACD